MSIELQEAIERQKQRRQEERRKERKEKANEYRGYKR